MTKEECPQKNILLTGPPRIGKTTAAMAIASTLGSDAGGFYTDEIRERGKRKGFRITSLDGDSGILAHVDIKGGPRVGRYGVNVSEVERVGIEAIRRAVRSGKVVVVDEIGAMELLSKPFKLTILEALDSACPVIATIRQTWDPFTDSIKSRADVSLITLTIDNRDTVSREAVETLRKYLYCST